MVEYIFYRVLITAATGIVHRVMNLLIMSETSECQLPISGYNRWAGMVFECDLSVCGSVVLYCAEIVFLEETLLQIVRFLPHSAMHKRGLCCRAVSVRPSRQCIMSNE